MNHRRRSAKDSGADWPEHWAIQPPTKNTAPDGGNGWLVENTVDLFIHARLREHGLSPEPEASKETLIRRVTLDLTGLPATLHEIDEYLADDSPHAYERALPHADRC